VLRTWPAQSDMRLAFAGVADQFELFERMSKSWRLGGLGGLTYKSSWSVQRGVGGRTPTAPPMGNPEDGTGCVICPGSLDLAADPGHLAVAAAPPQHRHHRTAQRAARSPPRATTRHPFAPAIRRPTMAKTVNLTELTDIGAVHPGPTIAAVQRRERFRQG
jgi:hypothetical protein